MLMDRLETWTDDRTILALFEDYYTRTVEDGGYSDFDPVIIVDNDYNNWYSVMDEEELEDNFPDEEERKNRISAEKDEYYLVYIG